MATIKPLLFLLLLMSLIPPSQAPITVPTNMHFGMAGNVRLGFSTAQTFTSVYRSNNYWYFGNFAYQVVDANMTINVVPPNKLTFTVTANAGVTSTTRIYCGIYGQPLSVSGATTYSYDLTNQTETITVLHSSSETVTLDWELPSTPHTPIIDVGITDPLFTLLVDGNVLGFVIACYTSRIGQAFYGILILIFSVVFYNRLKSVPALAVMWLILGGTFLGVMRVFSPIAVLLVALGLSGVIYSLFEKEQS